LPAQREDLASSLFFGRSAVWLACHFLFSASTSDRPRRAAEAPSYPLKPIRIVAPFAAGGGVDFVARSTSQELTAGLGRPVVVDNRAVAGGNIGIEIVAKAPAGGYTPLVVSNSLTVNASLYRKCRTTHSKRL
jgi:tripartite-type tricarboxylate transporter receptor subunit TctC